VLFRQRLQPALVSDWFRRLGFVFLLNIAFSLVPGISWQAHLGGAAAGFAAAALLHAMRSGNRWYRVLAVLLLAALPALCVGGLFAAMKAGDTWAPLRPRPHAPIHNLIPLPTALQPDAIHPLEIEASRFLMLGPGRRTPERTADLRGRVEAVRGRAVELADQLARLHGSQEADAQRARWQAFATARADSLGMLLVMLNTNTIPDAATWQSWGRMRREADRLWAEAVIHAESVKPALPAATTNPPEASP
jgi:hypothetical protein